MKIYSATARPPKLNHPFDFKAYEAAVDDYIKAVKAELIASGYTGVLTGEIYSTPRGDGMAQYMYADHPAPRKSCLIWLEHEDAWHDPNVQFIPQAEIKKRILQRKRFAS